jgi:hypothetical protein
MPFIRTQVGDVFREGTGDELLVYLTQFVDVDGDAACNNEPDEILITGKACDIRFDPSKPADRQAVYTLISRLAEALTLHQQRCHELYGAVEVGDYLDGIREPSDDEARCSFAIAAPGPIERLRCSRVEHLDAHHVAVDDSYQVTAVYHPIEPVRPLLTHATFIEHLRKAPASR